MLFWDESFKKFCAKIKTLKFETKIETKIRHPKICRNAQNCAKQKKKKQLSDQKCLRWVFLGCMFEKVLSYFQHPRICQNAKFRAKLKILIFRTKIV